MDRAGERRDRSPARRQRCQRTCCLGERHRRHGDPNKDTGQNWVRLNVPETGKLDFRDVDAIDERTAYVLSIGPGEASRIYKTSDAGKSWRLQFRNAEPRAFYDAMAFRDERRGFAFSDSVDNTFVILQTSDGGNSWNRVPDVCAPAGAARRRRVRRKRHKRRGAPRCVWITTTASRVLSIRGRRAVVDDCQDTSGERTVSRDFSIAFRDAQHGIVVGGDFKKEAEAVDNAAVTDSGGRNWITAGGLSGYRSAVAYAPAAGRTVVAVGPSGTDVSFNDGRSWIAVPGPEFHAISFAPRSRVAWAVERRGR